jgi:energy-coupling factor transport system permease protein
VILGYVPGEGVLHRAHPFTPLTIAGGTALLAFLLPGPVGPWSLAGVIGILAVVAGLAGVLATVLAFSAPLWVFLALIYGVFGNAPVLGVTFAGRITAILLGFLLALAAVHPGRLVDAMVARRVPFAIAYLLAATLQAVPRLQRQAATILEAQRCRGLRVGGSPWRRLRGIVPLALPLVQGALAEADDRAVALEVRGAVSGHVRTPLHPPRDHAFDRTVRWGMGLLVLAAGVLRVVT